jgi:hypothetical protein
MVRFDEEVVMTRCRSGRERALLAAIASLAVILPATAAPAVETNEVEAPAIETPAVEAQPAARRFGLTLSYFGDGGTHPGILAAAEYPVLGSGGKHEVLARVHLGGYVHPRMYSGLFTGGEVAYRATAGFGLRGEIAAGAAYLRTFIASDVYEVEPDGSVSETTDWGRSHFMPSASFGIGWDFGRRGGLPLAVMLRNQAFWEIPYNTRSLLHLAAIVGVAYTR